MSRRKAITIEVTQEQLDALGSLINEYAEGHMPIDGRSTPRSRGTLDAADRLYNAIDRELTKRARS